MKQICLFLLSLVIPIVGFTQNNLFFSEYLEGSSQNKALEIFNPTPNTISLDGYRIQKFSNGSSVATEELEIVLDSGPNVIEPYDAIIITNGQIEPNDYGSVDSVLYAMADMHGTGLYTNSPMYYNGNDAIALLDGNGMPVDLIGKIGEDPINGWCPYEEFEYIADDDHYWLSWTANNRLIRKPSINSGVTSNPEFFNPGLEWDSVGWDYDNIDNNWATLGWHEWGTTYEVSFHVTSNNEDIENATITVSGQTIQTNANGIATVNLNSGPHSYVINANGYEQYTGTFNVESSPLTVDIELTAVTNYEIAFTILGINNSPLEGATINIGGIEVNTNADGSATVNLSNGTWGYTIEHQNYESLTGELFVDGANVDISIEMNPLLYDVLFIVQNTDNEPIEDAAIAIYDQVIYTESDGHISISLPIGEYTYTMTAENYLPYDGSIAIENEDVNVYINAIELHTAIFHVESSGTNIENALILIGENEIETDENGEAEINLPDGIYSFTVTAENFEEYSQDFEIDGADVSLYVSLTGTENIGENSISITPNPANEWVKISCSGENTIKLFNANGMLMCSACFVNESTISVENYASGIYYVIIANPNYSSSQKLIIE